MPRHRASEPQIARCITLLLALARSRRGIQLASFAERQGWNLRTTYRDVETLCDAGVPVEHAEQGWYRVSEAWMPPGTVGASGDELFALLFARQLMQGLKDTALGRAFDALWCRLSTPGRQPALALDDAPWIATRAPCAIDYGRHRVVLDVVREAIRQRSVVEIHYRKADGTETTRAIEPAVVRWDSCAEAAYVFAWCRMRQTPRVFALHRITDAQLTGEHCARRREMTAELDKAFRLWPRARVEHVTLRFSPRVAGEIRERNWHATARVTDTPEGGVVLEMDIAAPAELERWLLGFAADVQIEAPSSLAVVVHARHVEAARRAHLGTLAANRTSAVERTAIAGNQDTP